MVQIIRHLNKCVGRTLIIIFAGNILNHVAYQNKIYITLWFINSKEPLEAYFSRSVQKDIQIFKYYIHVRAIYASVPSVVVRKSAYQEVNPIMVYSYDLLKF